MNRAVKGVVVARVDLETSLYDLLLNRTGMGYTGGTLIVNRDVVALNELRYHDNAPLRLKIEARPAVMAAGGKTGITETVDYRGEKILAAYTHISRTGWGFVAKQDLSEVYEPITAMRTNFLIILAVPFLVIYLAALFLSSSLVRPIGELAEELLEPFSGDKFTGELGRALATRKISHIKEIPKDTLFTFTTIAGTAVPRELLIIPLLTRDQVAALISLGTLKSFSLRPRN